MTEKTIKSNFGQFIFLDDHAVVAEANYGVNIDADKAQYAIGLIEKELLNDYAMILDRKADYSIMPIEVYEFFNSRERLKAIAIIEYKKQSVLSGDLEQRIFKGLIEKFASKDDAHEWINEVMQTK